MPWISLGIYPVWDLFSFFNPKAYIFFQIQNCFSHFISLNILSTLSYPSETLIIGTLNLLLLSVRSLWICINFPNLFSLCCSYWVNSDYKLDNFILCYLQSIIEPIQCFFLNSVIVFFHFWYNFHLKMNSISLIFSIPIFVSIKLLIAFEAFFMIAA